MTGTQTQTIGIDTAKRVLFLYGESHVGRVAFRKKLTRDQLLPILPAREPHCPGGRLRCPSLGTIVFEARARGPADPPEVRASVRRDSAATSMCRGRRAGDCRPAS